MAIRELLRGSVPWPRLEAVMREFAERYDRDRIRVTFLEADNWLSIPCVVDDEWFLKIVTPQNSLVHGFITAGRNLGVFSSGTEGFFEHFDTPLEMAEHEFEATRRMREIGLNAPEPLDVFEVDGLGVLVLEFLPEFRTLEGLDAGTVEELAPELFAILATLHDNRLAHGDLRAENVLVVDGELYFIDVTNVREEGVETARGYDIACALGVLEPIVGARAAVAAARSAYATEDLLAARRFLDFVNMRPDHDFDAVRVKGEIEKAAG